MSTPSPIQPPDPSSTGGAPPAPPNGADTSRGAVTTGVLVAAIALALAIGGVLGWLVSQSSSDSSSKTVTLTHTDERTLTTTETPSTETTTETETVTAPPETVTVTGGTTSG